MKKIFAVFLAMCLCCCFFASCTPADGDVVVFSEKNVVNASFSGLGVEWGTYEDVNKLATGAWQRICRAVDRLNPKLVRCMTNFDWFVYDFDDKGTDDLSDDVWKYDFDNKYMKNTCDILDHCQSRGIDVAFGVWNVIGSADESEDVWKMIPNATSDPRWAKLTADLMEYLVKIKGYDCIKWFVSSNEPNYTGAIGSSKNAYNTYEKWRTGVRNVRAALDGVGLQNVDIIGGDTTGFAGSAQYLTNIARDLSDTVSNYGVHLYISNYDIDNAAYAGHLKQLYDGVKALDGKLGVEKPFIIWESGLLDGKNVATDSNSFIANYSYGIRMADYTVQSILAGADGISYWDLDDAMHFMYTESGSNAKEWGMFSTLAAASAAKQEYRPWFHSSTLLTNLLSRGCTVYAGADEDNFRALGVTDADGANGGFVAINRGTQPITKTFRLEKSVTGGGKLYVYVFNEQNLRLDEDGFVLPNCIVDGSVNKDTTVEMPAGSLLVVSSRAL